MSETEEKHANIQTAAMKQNAKDTA